MRITPVLHIATLLLVIPIFETQAEAIFWNGSCALLPGGNNRWGTRCTVPGGGFDASTNWSNDKLPTRDDDVTIGAGIPGGTSIATSFAIHARTINSQSPLHVVLNGPIFIFGETGTSIFTDLTIDGGGQISPFHDTILRGNTYLSRGFFAEPFGDADSFVLTNEGTFTIEGQPPNPFASTAMTMKKFVNTGTVFCSGPISTVSGNEIENHGTWEFRNENSVISSDGSSFLNKKGATLRINGDTQDALFRIGGSFTNEHNAFRPAESGKIELQKGVFVLANKGNSFEPDHIAMSPGTTFALGEGAADWFVPAGEWEFAKGTLGPESGSANLEVQLEAKLTIVPAPFNQKRILRNLNWVNEGTVLQRQNGFSGGQIFASLEHTGDQIINETTGTWEMLSDFKTSASIQNKGMFSLREILDMQHDKTFINEAGAQLDLGRARVRGKNVGGTLTTFVNHGSLDVLGVRRSIGSNINFTHCLVQNHGTATIDAIDPVIFSESRFENKVGATCTIDGAVEQGAFSNEGTINGGERGIQMRSFFQMTGGSVHTSEGGGFILNHSSSNQGTGTITLASIAPLWFLSGPHDFNGDYVVQGDSSMRLEGSPGRAVNGPPELRVSGGTFTVNLPKSRVFEFDGPGLAVEKEGKLRVDAGATLNLAGVAGLLNASEVRLGGALTMPASAVFLNGRERGASDDEGKLVLVGAAGAPKRFAHRYESLPRSAVVASGGPAVFASVVNDVVDGDELVQGDWVVEAGATLDIEGMSQLDVIQRLAHLTLEGGGRFLPLDRSDSLIQDGFFELEDGASYTFDGFWECNGLFSVDEGCSLTVNGQFESNDKARLWINGSLTTPDLDNDGGSYSGSGTINAQNFNNKGELSPGASPGTLTVNGNFTQFPDGQLTVEINGSEAGTEYDQLVVSGAASLGGKLLVCLHSSYRPAPGTSFTILSAGSLSGDFESVSVAGSGGRIGFTVQKVGAEVRLIANAAAYPTYAAWQSAKFDAGSLLDPLVVGPGADPEGDSVANLFEYVSGLRPTKADARPVAVVPDPGGSGALLTLPWADDVTGVGISLQRFVGGAYQDVVVEELPSVPHSPGVQLRRFRLTESGVLHRVRLQLE